MEPSILSAGGTATCESGGFFLSLVGSKGGQGASMLASLLAGVVSRERKTVLLDLDYNSTHRHLLDRENCSGVSNLAMVINELSSPEISGFVQRHPLGFDLLPGVRNPEEEQILTPIKLNLIFKLLAEMYEVVLLDISSNHRFVSMGILNACSLNLMIVRPDLLSLRCAMRVMESSHGSCPSTPAPWALIVNQEKISGLVRPFQASEVLALRLLAVLPEDPPAGEDFSNLLKTGLGRTPYVMAVESLAERLRLIEGTGSVPNRRFSSRCLNALRAWSAGAVEEAPRGHAFPPGEGSPCAG